MADETEVREHIEDRRGILCGEHEWLAGMIWTARGPVPLIGTLEPPAEGQMMIARFRDIGTDKWTPCLCIQELLPGLYYNCVSGELIHPQPEWELVVFSGVSRTLPDFRLQI